MAAPTEGKMVYSEAQGCTNHIQRCCLRAWCCDCKSSRYSCFCSELLANSKKGLTMYDSASWACGLQAGKSCVVLQAGHSRVETTGSHRLAWEEALESTTVVGGGSACLNQAWYSLAYRILRAATRRCTPRYTKLDYTCSIVTC